MFLLLRLFRRSLVLTMSERTFEVLRRPMTVNGTTYKVGQKFKSDTLRWEAWVRTGMAKEVPAVKRGRPRKTKTVVEPVETAVEPETE